MALIMISGLLASSNFEFRIFTLIWIYALAVVGLNILMGYGGQVSLGHAGFVAIGAYSVAIGSNHLGFPVWLAVLVGPILSGLVAALIGRPLLRLQGYYLAVATLGFGLLINMVFVHEGRLTGGPDGISIPPLEIGSLTIAGPRSYFWITGMILVIGVWVAANFIRSSSGRALQSLHDTEIAAASAGINVAQVKLTAFIISAVFAGVAGSLFALASSFVTPEVSGLLASVELVSMLLLGGLQSIVGSVIGAAAIIILPQVLASFHDYEPIFLGLIIMLTMTFFPMGIVPALTKLFRRILR